MLSFTTVKAEVNVSAQTKQKKRVQNYLHLPALLQYSKSTVLHHLEVYSLFSLVFML